MVNIGKHDRGAFDKEDRITANPNPLKNKVSAKEAEDFARSNSGAELIIKNDDGTYSVYELNVSEKGKDIINSDFIDDNISLSEDIAKKFTSGKKAYIMTNDNVLRTLEIKGIDLIDLEHEFVSFRLNTNLEDLDGIETKSKNDIVGRIEGNIKIDKKFLEYLFAQAEKEMGVGISLSYNDSENKYTISISKGVKLGDIELKMNGAGIDLSIDGGLAVDFVTGLVNYNPVNILTGNQIYPEAIVKNLIQNYLVKEIGLKAIAKSSNSLRLEPDFTNGSLIKTIPVGDMNIKLEQINADKNKTFFDVDNKGNLIINLDAQIIGSSDTKAPRNIGKDLEGTDKFNTSVKGKLINDFSFEIESDSNLKLNVTSEEKNDLSKRIKSVTGRNIALEGEVELKDVKTKVRIDSEGSIKIGEKSSGKIISKNINVDLGVAEIKVNSTNGDLSLETDNNKATIKAENVNFNAEVKSQNVKVNLYNVKLNGNIKYDKADPNKVSIESKRDSGVEFDVNITDKSGNSLASAKDFRLNAIKSEFDFQTGNFTLEQIENNSSAKVGNLKIGNNIDIKNLNFQGDLRVNAYNKSINIDAKNIELNGKLGEVNIKELKASAKINYDSKKGIKIENLNLQKASGKIGNFDISKMSGKSDLSFDNKGNLLLANVSNFFLNTDLGLKLKGDFKVSHNNGVFELNTSAKKPINLSYKPKDKQEDVVTGLLLDGNIKYDSNNNSFSFNNSNAPLRIQRGTIKGTSFNNFKLDGEMKLLEDGSIQLYNSKKNIKLSGSIGSLNIKELSSDGQIIYNPNNNSIKSTGKLTINIPDKKLNVVLDGDVTLTQNKYGKYVLSGNNVKINAKIGNIDIKNTVVNGTLEIDPISGKLTLGGNETFSVEGNLQGKNFNFKTNGKFTFIPEENGSVSLSSEGFKFDGNIEGLNIKSKDGLKGSLNLNSKGEISNIKDFEFNFEIEGVKFENRGKMDSSSEEYNIKLDGKIASEPSKINDLLEKISNTGLVPASYKESIKQVNEKIKSIDLKTINYKDLNIKLDKNYNFESIDFTVSNTDINLPNRNISIKTEGDIKFGFDKNNNFLLESRGTKINANIESIKFDDLSINGRIVYDNSKKVLSMEGLDGKELEIKGKFNKHHEIDLKSIGKLEISKNEKGLEFSGGDININGNLDGFSVKTLRSATGKILFNDNGKLDLSDLKFDIKIDDIEINNTDGSINVNSEKGYDIKFSGNISSSQENLIKFLDKISKNDTISEYTRKTIKETVDNVKNYMVYGNIKKAEYKDFTITLDKNLEYKGFKTLIDARMENTTVKTGIRNTNDIINLGTVEMKANVLSNKSSFNIRDGNITFELTPQVRESMKNAFVSVLKTFNLKDIDLEILPNGTMNLKRAIYDDIPIVNVEIGTKVEIEGKKAVVTLEKVELQGLLGKILQNIIDSTANGGVKKMGIEKVLEKITDMKINYKGEDNKFYIDLSDILYQHVGEDIQLKDIKIENGKFVMSYEAEVSNAKKPFSPTEVNNGISEIKKLLGSNKEEDRNKLRNIILNSEPENLTRILDHINLYSLKQTLKDDQKVIDILEKLAKSQNIGKNSDHLNEISSFVNDDISLGFERRIDKRYLWNMKADTKANFIKHLIDGHTNENEEKSIKAYILNSEPFNLSILLTKFNEDTLKSELDDSDYQAILYKLAKSSGIHFNDGHFNRFVRKANDDMIVSLIKELSNNDISKINIEGRKLMINMLMSGRVNDEEQKAILKIIMFSNEPKKLINLIGDTKLKDKLDNSYYLQISSVR